MDVKVIIFSLKKAGFSFRALAYLVSRDDKTIRNWVNGKGKPDYDIFLKLMAIYQEHGCGEKSAGCTRQSLSSVVN
jgi:hypothetical protein